MDSPVTARRTRWSRMRRHWLRSYLLGVGVLVGACLLAIFLFVLITVSRDSKRLRLTGKSLLFIAQAAPWVIAVTGGAIAILFATEERRFRANIRARRCTDCQYDLRGSIDAGRGECPECGCAIERLDS